MKRSGSWDLVELPGPMEAGGDGEIEDESLFASVLESLFSPRAAQKPRVCGDGDGDGDGDGGGGGGVPFSDGFCGDLDFAFGNRDAISSHSTGGPLTGSNFWSQNLTSRLSSISATIESQSSICAGSPTSSLKPKGTENLAPGGTSDSDQSDDESFDTEMGACGRSTNVSDLKLKRMRRMVSNRESARRSRKRKQAHLADLELQVDQLRGENSTLYKQLTDANQQFGEAATDNRVLKSDVEALRVKVKLAEDLVTRGSLPCGLDHLIQNHIGPAQLLAARHLCRASEVPPIIELQADETCYTNALAAGQVENIGMANSETKHGSGRIRLNQSLPLQSIANMENLQNRISSEVTSCVTDTWLWDTQPNTMSKPL